MKIVYMASGTINSSLSYRPLSFAKELVKYNHDVYILTPRFDKYSHYKVDNITEIEGVKVIHPFQPKSLPFQLGLLLYSISSLYYLLKLNPNIIHIFKANPITIQSLLLKLMRKVIILLDVDDLDAEVMKIEESPKVMIELIKISNHIASKFSNGVTCASKYLYRYYATNLPQKNIVYISNGADFSHPIKIKSKVISTNRIVFLGNMNRKNILEPLFFAIEKLAQSRLHVEVKIIGDGKYLSYFKLLTKKLRVSKYIRFLGHVPQSEIGKHLAVGDLGYCYMPNELTIQACSSMKVFQYMQYGVIPIVSNVGDFPLYTFSGRTGYITKRNTLSSLVDTLSQALATNNFERIVYTNTFAKKQYSWNQLTNKLNRFYTHKI